MEIAIGECDCRQHHDRNKSNTKKNNSLSFVQRPAVDGALGVLEELVIAIFWMRQTYRQSSKERQETHDATGLLVVETKPATSFGIERILTQCLMQPTHTTETARALYRMVNKGKHTTETETPGRLGGGGDRGR